MAKLEWLCPIAEERDSHVPGNDLLLLTRGSPGHTCFSLPHPVAVILALLLLAGSTIAIPGYMTHYCRNYDAREIFDPFRAFGRVVQGGERYWKAWAIALSALALSFLGVLALGIGFLVTSVWFWQVAGFSFASVFSQRFALAETNAEATSIV